jgi:twitching motility two-component system response regulator PilH
MITVLVVDDSITPRQMLSELLKSHGLKVIEAVNGIDAKNKLAESKVNIVVTDLIMPEMNGYELCRWIKNNPDTSNIPVLMCSTKSEEFDRYWGMKQGADAYITKPYQSGEMLKTIKSLLTQKS